MRPSAVRCARDDDGQMTLIALRVIGFIVLLTIGGAVPPISLLRTSTGCACVADVQVQPYSSSRPFWPFWFSRGCSWRSDFPAFARGHGSPAPGCLGRELSPAVARRPCPSHPADGRPIPRRGLP